MRKLMVAAFLTASLALTAAGQTIGTYVLWPDTAIDLFSVIIGPPPPDPARTYVNLSGPATSGGTIRMVAVRMSGPSTTRPCSVKVKFFRRTGAAISFFAETGPFSLTATTTKLTLPSPVEVQAGDLIGITLLPSCSYGAGEMGPIGQTMKAEGSAAIRGDASSSYLLYPSQGSTLPHARLLPALVLSIFGSSSVEAEVRSQVIVVAGSTAGVGGSRFKTEIQMANPLGPEFVFNPLLRGDIAHGRLVYHPAGTSGTPSDPSLTFKLERGQSRTLLDFVGDLGLSGVGSVDVYTTVGFEPPLAAARIFEDSSGGTKGLTIDAQTLDRALAEALPYFEATSAVLFAPSDPSRFRMNIGVRTLDSPVTLGFVIVRADGTPRTETVSRFYPPNYFTQIEAGQLLGTPLQAGDSIVVRAGLAPAFVYGSIIDNVSQDPSLQFASVLR